MSAGVNINLGSGHYKLDGWINVDLDAASRPDVLADLSAPLPFRDGVAALVHTEDFIDQLDLDKAGAFLRECHRVLQPGGVLRVLTPDLRQVAQLYLEDPGRLLALWNRFVGLPLALETAGEVLNQATRMSGRQFLFDLETLAVLARRCGFDPRPAAFNESDEPALRGIDLRSPDTALSCYVDCYRV